MNKLQYIKLFELRKVSLQFGQTAEMLMKSSGGEPTQEELNIVNQKVIEFYEKSYRRERERNEELQKRIEKMEVALAEEFEESKKLELRLLEIEESK